MAIADYGGGKGGGKDLAGDMVEVLVQVAMGEAPARNAGVRVTAAVAILLELDREHGRQLAESKAQKDDGPAPSADTVAALIPYLRRHGYELVKRPAVVVEAPVLPASTDGASIPDSASEEK